MTAQVVDVLAGIIRDVDGDNKLSPADLGIQVATFLAKYTDGCDGCQSLIVRFVERTNPDKTMGAGRLAELIVAEFGLDEEIR